MKSDRQAARTALSCRSLGFWATDGAGAGGDGRSHDGRWRRRCSRRRWWRGCGSRRWQQGCCSRRQRRGRGRTAGGQRLHRMQACRRQAGRIRFQTKHEFGVRGRDPGTMRQQVVQRAGLLNDLDLILTGLGRRRRRSGRGCRHGRRRGYGRGSRLGFRRGCLRRNRLDRGLARRRQAVAVRHKTVQRVFAARLHTGAIGDEIGTARGADSVALLCRRRLCGKRVDVERYRQGHKRQQRNKPDHDATPRQSCHCAANRARRQFIGFEGAVSAGLWRIARHPRRGDPCGRPIRAQAGRPRGPDQDQKRRVTLPSPRDQVSDREPL